MENKYNLYTILKSSDPLPRPTLERDISYAVVRYRKKILLIKRFIYGIISTGSAAIAIPVTIGLFSSLSQSGFYQYASLAFSDGGTIWNFGKEFVLVLAESLPVTSIIISLALIITTIWSLKKMAERTSFTTIYEIA